MAVKATGRQGLPAEAVLRCALLKILWEVDSELRSGKVRSLNISH